jgi:hypothetical protein
MERGPLYDSHLCPMGSYPKRSCYHVPHFWKLYSLFIREDTEKEEIKEHFMTTVFILLHAGV